MGHESTFERRQSGTKAGVRDRSLPGRLRLVTSARPRLAPLIRLLLLGLLLCLSLLAVAPAQADAADPKERVVITGPVLVDKGETSGDVVVIDGDVLVRGTVDGDLVVINGEVTLRGTVKGDVIAGKDKVMLGSNGRIDGDLRYGDKKPEGATPDKVKGDVERFDFESIAAPAGAGVVLLLWLAVTVSMFLLGLVVLLLFPRAADAVAKASIGKSLLVGLAVLILLPLLAILALVTIIGIPLGLVLLLTFVVLLAIAYVSAAWVLGRRILKPPKARILAFLVGLVLLRLLALIPFVGGLIGFLAVLLGLGALALAAGRSRKA